MGAVLSAVTGSALRRVLLDTSVVIAPPSAGLASIADFVAVSVISVAELEHGVGAADDVVERQRRRRGLSVIVKNIEVIPFDDAVAESYGVLANLVRAAGRDPRPRRLDLLIGRRPNVIGSLSRRETPRTSGIWNVFST